MSEFRDGDRRQWIQRSREQQAQVQQLEKGLVDPQEQTIRLQVLRALQGHG
jgi:hypothetical protein